ncbi:MAG: hypothetical protein PHO26_04465 [Dehalococcoidia bacterium]|nr:hypothetical protein [Dehalococcoidia bacterium]MDD5493870.1 hypothetical protein [Dehalococcoidia bacterium]
MNTIENLPVLKRIIEGYMRQVPMVHEHCDRCLASARWHANALLMVVDAAFDSIGLNYFQSVVPKVELFRQQFVETGEIAVMEDLVSADNDKLKDIWKNSRSWKVAKEMAAYLSSLKIKDGLDDRSALICWAKNSSLEHWQQDPVGSIRGVGINTYQYLRMMGGVDTVMPDKIVKKVIYAILDKAGVRRPESDIDFVLFVEQIAPEVGYRAIELCWMTWLVQSEAGLSRTVKYAALLPKI